MGAGGRALRHRGRRPAGLRQERDATSRRRCAATRKLARLAAALVAPGGFLFLASCSHHVAPGDFADAVALGPRPRAARRAASCSRPAPAPTIRSTRMLPESAYLKAMLFQLA